MDFKYREGIIQAKDDLWGRIEKIIDCPQLNKALSNIVQLYHWSCFEQEIGPEDFQQLSPAKIILGVYVPMYLSPKNRKRGGIVSRESKMSVFSIRDLRRN